MIVHITDGSNSINISINIDSQMNARNCLKIQKLLKFVGKQIALIGIKKDVKKYLSFKKIYLLFFIF